MICALLYITIISIHAPTKGATHSELACQMLRTDFNPRSHEGSDYIYAEDAGMDLLFQSTLPRRERQQARVHTDHRTNISIHAPTKGATFRFPFHVFPSFNFNPRSHEGSDMLQSYIDRMIDISIHAPTKGATRSRLGKLETGNISIHAPTKGATILRLRKH